MTGLFALALWRDPLAANDSALSSRRAVSPTGLRTSPVSSSGPGRRERPASSRGSRSGAALVAWLSVWLARGPTAGSRGRRAARAAFVALGLVLAAAALLERWPSSRSGPGLRERRGPRRRPGRVRRGPGARGATTGWRSRPGVTTVLVRAAERPARSPRLAAARGRYRASPRLPDRPPLVLRPEGARLESAARVAAIVDRTGRVARRRSCARPSSSKATRPRSSGSGSPPKQGNRGKVRCVDD